MEEIKVGEYIRNKDGYIDKVKKIIEPDEYMPEKYYCCDIIMASSYKSEIVKHSKQLIDLIEAGDIVEDKYNTYEVAFISENKIYCNDYNYDDSLVELEEKDIKTILTKEQFVDNCYKVGGKDE